MTLLNLLFTTLSCRELGEALIFAPLLIKQKWKNQKYLNRPLVIEPEGKPNLKKHAFPAPHCNIL